MLGSSLRVVLLRRGQCGDEKHLESHRQACSYLHNFCVRNRADYARVLYWVLADWVAKESAACDDDRHRFAHSSWLGSSGAAKECMEIDREVEHQRLHEVGMLMECLGDVMKVAPLMGRRIANLGERGAWRMTPK